jgi:hypothetical protein
LKGDLVLLDRIDGDGDMIKVGGMNPRANVGVVITDKEDYEDLWNSGR